MGRSGAGASGAGSCVGCDLSIQAMLRMMATNTATKRVPTMRERMAIWGTFLLFAYGTAIENGRVKTEASQLFSDHQQWFAAFLLAFPEAAVVPHDERDALSALISTSRKPSMWKIKDRALQWLSRSLRPATGRDCCSRLPRRSARKLARKSAADRRTRRIVAFPCCRDPPPIASYFQMQPCRIESNRRRVGHIQGLDGARHVEPCKCADGFACLLPQPFALGAQHQRHLLT
ncbi:hypothetical protein EV291_12071 [Rhizobium sp. BK068]|nr:hypothetical protein EV291_12071 [Rhizobium sp. BK068]